MPARFKRGQVVERPDAWEQRGRTKRGKAIVMAATSKSVTLCTFNPGRKVDASNPHVGVYALEGLRPIGTVKKMPKACTSTLAWKKEFWKEHPFFKIPKALAGAKRRKRKAAR